MNAFSVLYLPEYNFNFENKIYCVNNTLYHGFDRYQCEQLFLGVNMDNLPSEMKLICDEIEETRKIGLWEGCYYVTPSIDKAIQACDYSNSKENKHEVVAFESESINYLLGEQRDINFDFDFLGYDINAEGDSLVLNSFFNETEIFKEELSLMNKFGLLDNEEHANTLLNKYISIQKYENVEEINLEEDMIEFVKIYRLVAPSRQ